jgi:hypothetical protein
MIGSGRSFAFGRRGSSTPGVSDDGRALAEIDRVTRPGAPVVLSLPLYIHAWTFFDELVGHRRRYEPGVLAPLLAAHGLILERSAAYGMPPRSALPSWWRGLPVTRQRSLVLPYLEPRQQYGPWSSTQHPLGCGQHTRRPPCEQVRSLAGHIDSGGGACS